MYKKLLLLYVIGVVINLSGCVIGYFAGPLVGAIISLFGCFLTLLGTAGIIIQEHKEKRERRQKKKRQYK